MGAGWPGIAAFSCWRPWPLPVVFPQGLVGLPHNMAATGQSAAFLAAEVQVLQRASQSEALSDLPQKSRSIRSAGCVETLTKALPVSGGWKHTPRLSVGGMSKHMWIYLQQQQLTWPLWKVRGMVLSDVRPALRKDLPFLFSVL